MLLAFYHAAAFTLIHYAAFKMPGGWVDFLEVYVTLLLAVMTGMMVGLMASAMSNNPGVTPLIMICLIVPMFILSGGLATLPTYMSAWTSSHWAFQALMGISGMGTDVVRDPCWQLPKQTRNDMTLDDKAYFQCNCMGLNIFNPDSCNFPGLGAFYVPEISEPAPQAPAGLPAAPPEPVLPSPPQVLQDISNQVQVVQYLNALKKYQEEVSTIQSNYQNEMEIYRATADIYQSKMIEYQENLANYTVARVTAVSAGEGLINAVASDSIWSWVDKDNPKTYYPWLFRMWYAQGILMAIYFCIILILVKMKDVH